MALQLLLGAELFDAFERLDARLEVERVRRAGTDPGRLDRLRALIAASADSDPHALAALLGEETLARMGRLDAARTAWTADATVARRAAVEEALGSATRALAARVHGLAPDALDAPSPGPRGRVSDERGRPSRVA